MFKNHPVYKDFNFPLKLRIDLSVFMSLGSSLIFASLKLKCLSSCFGFDSWDNEGATISWGVLSVILFF